jgi:hypothetical protein
MKKAFEPDWWRDFIDACFPEAKHRDYKTAKQLYPSVIREGEEWAARRRHFTATK